ncbi:hypothetical protein BDF14DRAFT_258684 [Spinellus fusiger]|nr:hypothetical protein BDF14DRAFT_258684 [Spinellus fusiger]
MWYCSWLFILSVIAAICSAFSIRTFTQEHHIFTSEYHTSHHEKQETQATLQIITRCCACYSIGRQSKQFTDNNATLLQVPIISKAVGITLQILVINNIYVPYGMFVWDRVSSSILGVLISCIYFTDPDVTSILSELIRKAKQHYVDDYYCLKMIPDTNINGDLSKDLFHQCRLVVLYTLPDELEKSHKDTISMSPNDPIVPTEVYEDNPISMDCNEYQLSPVNITDASFLHQNNRHNEPSSSCSQMNTLKNICTSSHYSAYLATVDGIKVKRGHCYKDKKIGVKVFFDEPLQTSPGPHTSSAQLRRLHFYLSQWFSDSSGDCCITLHLHRLRSTKNPETVHTTLHPEHQIEINRWLFGHDYLQMASFQRYRYPMVSRCMHWLLSNIFKVRSPGMLNPMLHSFVQGNAIEKIHKNSHNHCHLRSGVVPYPQEHCSMSEHHYEGSTTRTPNNPYSLTHTKPYGLSPIFFPGYPDTLENHATLSQPTQSLSPLPHCIQSKQSSTSLLQHVYSKRLQFDGNRLTIPTSSSSSLSVKMNTEPLSAADSPYTTVHTPMEAHTTAHSSQPSQHSFPQPPLSAQVKQDVSNLTLSSFVYSSYGRLPTAPSKRHPSTSSASMVYGGVPNSRSSPEIRTWPVALSPPPRSHYHSKSVSMLSLEQDPVLSKGKQRSTSPFRYISLYEQEETNTWSVQLSEWLLDHPRRVKGRSMIAVEAWKDEKIAESPT